MGETAPLLFTTAGVLGLTFNLSAQMNALPLQIYSDLAAPQAAIVTRAWGSALTLVAMVLLLNLLARLVSRASAFDDSRSARSPLTDHQRSTWLMSTPDGLPNGQQVDSPAAPPAAASAGEPTRQGVSANGGHIVGIDALNAYYGKQHALKDVSVVFPAGEATAIIGPSGCGKSTVVRCINRMHEEIPRRPR